MLRGALLSAFLGCRCHPARVKDDRTGLKAVTHGTKMSARMPTTRKEKLTDKKFVRTERSPVVIEVIVNRHVELVFPQETWDVEEETMTDLHSGRNEVSCPHRKTGVGSSF